MSTNIITMIKKLFLFLGIFSAAVFSAQNQFLDPTFGTNGVFTYTPNNAYGFAYEAGAVTSQNKIIVSGSHTAGPYVDQTTNFVQRLNADGTIDNTFNTLIIPPSNQNGAYTRLQKICIQPDQKIILGDMMGTKILRLNENGTYDMTFGNNGVINTSILFDPYFPPYGVTGPFRLSNVLLTFNNKILLCMEIVTDQEATYMITRLNENGSIDTSFGNNGIILQKSGFGRLLLQNDSKIVFIGQKYDGTFLKSRYTTDGILDAIYNNNNLQYTPLSGYVTYLFDTANSDNNIYIYGFSSSVTGEYAITLMKLDQYGELDTTFGTNGIVNEPYYNSNNYYVDNNGLFPTLLLDNSNNIYVVNMASPTGNSIDMNQFIKKFKPNGSVDTGFGNNGVVDVDLGYRDTSRSAIITPDQKIMMFGNHQTPSKGIITRVLNNTNTLSVKNQEAQKVSLGIYPNPVKDILYLKNIKSKDSNAEVIDISGKIIMKLLINNNKVDVSSLVKGVYFLKVGETTHKFIKE